ncbi:methionine-rich copper-binding protein CopC [Paenibacillus phyllosphaerae]|uniref:Methionine-rich copper-binding protein CopC n=1 Tax=Paenibacillus phyllosphaerae TaxID=274593 RepID=A0A7W5AXX1_9BACL|nr:S-layer homology domain-containing protein [Paenibacillus phyllosphaerae]MBB3110752.1 methionine-rich copper-binding protein CopC [Paenibacillus phyllosphaerae]
MNILRDELKKTKSGYEITIYLADNQTEFAEELGNGGNSGAKASIADYVKKKYPNLKVTVAKVVLGGVVLGTIPLAGGAASAAAAGPTDLDKASGYAKSAIERLVTQGVITGDQTGAFNPTGTMTRDALTTVLVKALVGQTDLVNPETPTFKDVPKTHWAYQYIETAVAKGWIKGTSGDTFSPTGTLTREQLATILVRTLGLTDDNIKGASSALTFADKDAISSFAQDSVAFAVANGLMTGADNNQFNGKGSATREQVAVVVDRFVTNKDKLQEAADAVKNASFTATAGDPNTITIAFKTAVDTLAAEDVAVKTADGTALKVTGVTLSEDKKTATVKTDTMTAGTAYTVTVSKEAVKGSATVTAPAALEYSAKPVGVKKIQVNFGTAVADTAAVKIGVKNPTGTTLTVSDVEYSADKTSATVTVASNLVAGTYTVTAGGVQSTDLSTTFTAEAEKVAKIEFASDKAVIGRVTTANDPNFGNADPLSITTQFKITNQYGEDITKAKQSQLTISAGKGTYTLPSTGTLKLTSTTAYEEGDTVTVTTLDSDTNTFASAVLTVSAPAKVSEITIDQLYNEDNDTLDVGDTAGDFSLVLTAKDQYGMNITDPSFFAKDTVVSVSNTSVVNVDGGASTPNVTYDESLDKLVLGLVEPTTNNNKMTAGTSKVTIVSKTTGKLASFDVVVKEDVMVDTISLSAPTVAAAGSSISVPFSAIDQDGKEMTSVDELTAGVSSITLSDGKSLGNGISFKKDLATGKVNINVEAIANTGTYTMTVITGTNKVSTLKLVVTDAKVPTTISTVTDLTKTFAIDAEGEFDFDNITILDQYDSEITPTWGSGANEYRLTVTPSNGYLTYEDGSGGALTELTDGGVFVANTKGTTTVDLVLQQNVSGVWTNVADYSFKTKVVEKDDIKSYELTDISTLLNDGATGYTSDHDRTVVVNGLLSDGSKVTVPTTENYYTITTSNPTDLTVTDGVLTASYDGADFDDNGNLTETVFVTVNDSKGTVLEKTVTVSNNAVKYTKLELVDGTYGNKENENQVSIGLAALKGLDNTDTTTVAAADLKILAADVVKATDQYGVEIKTDNYSVVASGFDGATSLTDLGTGDSFYLTAVAGGQKIVFQVTISGA